MPEISSEDKETLKKYLSQYYRSCRRKSVLDERLKNFRLQMIGSKAQKYSHTPRSQTNNVTDECAEFCIREEEIQERIEAERKKAASAMLKVMDVLNFLQEDSEEKAIMEMRYLDNKSWKEIAELQCMSKSRCIDYWNMGMDQLLQFKKVRVTLEEYRKVRGK